MGEEQKCRIVSTNQSVVIDREQAEHGFRNMFCRISKDKGTPFISIAVGAFAIIGMLLISAGATTFMDALNAGISATGVFVSFFYGFTGLSCAMYFYKRGIEGIWNRVIYIFWPILSVIALFASALVSVTQFNALTAVTVLCGVAIGVAIMVIDRQKQRA